MVQQVGIFAVDSNCTEPVTFVYLSILMILYALL